MPCAIIARTGMASGSGCVSVEIFEFDVHGWRSLPVGCSLGSKDVLAVVFEEGFLGGEALG